EDQFRAELADMAAHGVPHASNYQPWEMPQLRRVLEIRQELGLPTDRFYNLGRTTGSPKSQGELARLSKDIGKWVALCREFGYEGVYFYGIDEARDERLAAQRVAWKAVQDAGGKTFEAMGDLLDCAVLANRPDPEEARKWHSVGSEAFCYAYPQVGPEEPETFRRNFGLVLWKSGFDGAMDYAYQHGFTHVWNDFDNKTYRDHNFTYPTVSGVVGTVQWEGFREAVDDVRYVRTLLDAMEAAPDSKATTVRKARAWLDALEADSVDLYAARARMAGYIAELTQKP
ncbi:MAG: hypothetical protein GY851_16400, partial [bacterium]|nr:hypothetical protein [bacterium]